MSETIRFTYRNQDLSSRLKKVKDYPTAIDTLAVEELLNE